MSVRLRRLTRHVPRARNDYGKSSFAIVESAPVIWFDPDSNDTIC